MGGRTEVSWISSNFNLKLNRDLFQQTFWELYFVKKKIVYYWIQKIFIDFYSSILSIISIFVMSFEPWNMMNNACVLVKSTVTHQNCNILIFVLE